MLKGRWSKIYDASFYVLQSTRPMKPLRRVLWEIPKAGALVKLDEGKVFTSTSLSDGSMLKLSVFSKRLGVSFYIAFRS